MPTIEIAEFVTMENIPVLETGIAYPASTGPFSVTREMLSSAVEFATLDPHGHAPRIKIAHAQNPIDDDLQDLFAELNEGRKAEDPSFGTILNLRTENDGHTLVGDWYGLPAWLAAILETAYPARSIEGGSWVNEANNKNYDLKIEAVSLLGVVGPGCTSLADLQEYFSAEGPKVSVIEMETKTTKMGGNKSMPVQLQVNVEDVRRAFYDQFAQGDRYWWWDRELLADPWEFIAEDFDTGQLYRVPIDVQEDANGYAAVTFGEPEAIQVKYVPDPGPEGADQESDEKVAAAALSVAPRIKGAGQVVALNTTPPRRKEKPAMGINIPALRTALGLSETDLPDDATEEQVNEALAAASEGNEESGSGDGTGNEGDEEQGDGDGDGEGGDSGDGVQASGGNVIQVDRAVWEETRRGAQTALELQAQNDRAENVRFLESAIREGRITPASRESYLTQMNGPKNNGRGPARDSIKAMIEKLPAGVVPVDERGHSEGETTEASSGSMRGTGLFPDLEARRERERQEA